MYQIYNLDVVKIERASLHLYFKGPTKTFMIEKAKTIIDT